jgi:hypothetical protein
MKFLALFLILSAIAGAACAPQNSVANSNSTMQREHSNMNHGGINNDGMSPQNTNPGTMNHSAMTSSPNASSAPYDLQYIDTM